MSVNKMVMRWWLGRDLHGVGMDGDGAGHGGGRAVLAAAREVAPLAWGGA
jgi:hypothetical protein